VIAIQRNISSGENKAEVVVLKNRFTGETGSAGSLTYDKETGRLTATPLSDLFTTTTPDSYNDF